MNEEVMANNLLLKRDSGQKNGVAFSIIDDSIKQFFRRNGLHTVSLVNPNAYAKDYDKDVKLAAEKGDPYFFVADSIEELADKMGVNKENFVKTVEEYNGYCQTRDELFCKNHRYMQPLVGPKYYALQIAGRIQQPWWHKDNYKPKW